ncbi:MAG: glutathionylspermidine synthase family protein [Phycisphaerales bacterium]
MSRGRLGIAAGPALDRSARRELRRRLVFEWGKWDPQNADGAAVAPFAIELDTAEWKVLVEASEALAAELVAAERALLAAPRAWPTLALPRGFTAALRRASRDGSLRCAGPRVLRFDFHPTTDGWRLSEVNADVPGGFIEAAALAHLVKELGGGEGDHPGDPGEALADALAAALGGAGDVAMMHATAFTDDGQVMVHLARRLVPRGLRAHLVAPDHVCACAPAASAPAASVRQGLVMRTGWREGQIDAIVRFFPAEWLPGLPRSADWSTLLRAEAPQCNPPTALLAQSKRLVLATRAIGLSLPWWERFLPETRDPRDVPRSERRRAESWILKPALGRVGEGIAIAGAVDERVRRRIALNAMLWPRHWIAQRRFDSVALTTGDGPRHLCLGVYVVAGRAAGVYGRLAPRPLIDARAQDVAVLIRRSPTEAANSRREPLHGCAIAL